MAMAAMGWAEAAGAWGALVAEGLVGERGWEAGARAPGEAVRALEAVEMGWAGWVGKGLGGDEVDAAAMGWAAGARGWVAAAVVEREMGVEVARGWAEGAAGLVVRGWEEERGWAVAEEARGWA